MFKTRLMWSEKGTISWEVRVVLVPQSVPRSPWFRKKPRRYDSRLFAHLTVSRSPVQVMAVRSSSILRCLLQESMASMMSCRLDCVRGYPSSSPLGVQGIVLIEFFTQMLRNRSSRLLHLFLMLPVGVSDLNSRLYPPHPGSPLDARNQESKAPSFHIKKD